MCGTPYLSQRISVVVWGALGAVATQTRSVSRPMCPAARRGILIWWSPFANGVERWNNAANIKGGQAWPDPESRRPHLIRASCRARGQIWQRAAEKGYAFAAAPVAKFGNGLSRRDM